jgi:hypothetical protein
MTPTCFRRASLVEANTKFGDIGGLTNQSNSASDFAQMRRLVITSTTPGGISCVFTLQLLFQTHHDGNDPKAQATCNVSTMLLATALPSLMVYKLVYFVQAS